MKRLLQILLVLALLLAAAYHFLIDGAIKSIIEKQASNALKAKVNIADAEFHPAAGSLTLKGVQAADPHAPMRNLAQADSVSLAFDLRAVLARRIVADQVEVHGLRFDQPRNDSGAIAGLTPDMAPPAAPMARQPDTPLLVTQARQDIQEPLRRARAEASALHDQWRQRLQNLTDESRIKRLRERAQQLNTARPAERNAGMAQLRRDVQAELAVVEAARQQFDNESQRAQQDLANVGSMPDRELDRLMTNTGISRGDNGAGALLGAHLKTLLNQLLAMAAVANDSGNTQDNGQWFMLARKIIFDGQYDLARQPLRFTGVINNATPQPAFWNVPMTFTLNGAADQPGRLNAAGTLDLRDTSGQVNFSLNQVPVAGLALGGPSDMNITLEKANATSDGQFTLKANRVDLKIDSHFQQAALAVHSSDGATAQALQQALSGMTEFDLDALANGAAQNPVVSVRSTLDQQLAGAVSAQLQQQSGALGAQMRTQLQQALAPDLAAIEQLRGEIEQIRQALGERQRALIELANLR